MPKAVTTVVALLAALTWASMASAQNKVPSERALEALVKVTLLSFNDANVTGNYTVFHAKLSQAVPPAILARAAAETFKDFAEQGHRLRHHRRLQAGLRSCADGSTTRASCSSKAGSRPSRRASSVDLSSSRRTASGSSSASTSRQSERPRTNDPQCDAAVRLRPRRDRRRAPRPVQRFAADEIAPIAAEIDKTDRFPRELWPQDGRARPARHHGRGGVWRLRAGLSRARRRHGGVSAAPRPRSACPTARTPTSASTRSAATAPTTQKRRYLPKLISGEHVGALAMSGAGRGLRRRLDEAARREEGRPLRPERHQDVDHQRPRRARCSWSMPRPIRRPARAASPPSSSRRASRASTWRRSSTRWACAAPHRRAGVRGLRDPGGERAGRRSARASTC